MREIMQDSYIAKHLPRAAPLLPTLPKAARKIPFGHLESHFCRVVINRSTFFNQCFRKPSDIAKVDPEVAKDVNFNSLWMICGTPLTLIFRIFCQSAEI